MGAPFLTWRRIASSIMRSQPRRLAGVKYRRDQPTARA
jgi:hypothetical protein